MIFKLSFSGWFTWDNNNVQSSVIFLFCLMSNVNYEPWPQTRDSTKRKVIKKTFKPQQNYCLPVQSKSSSLRLFEILVSWNSRNCSLFLLIYACQAQKNHQFFFVADFLPIMCCLQPPKLQSWTNFWDGLIHCFYCTPVQDII